MPVLSVQEESCIIAKELLRLDWIYVLLCDHVIFSLRVKRFFGDRDGESKGKLL